MNIISIIQDALTALNSDAEVFLLEEKRADNEELEHTKDTIIVYPDWETDTTLKASLEVNEVRRYNIEFKTPDEWDNSDADNTRTYNDKTSVDRIEEMTTLANSVFVWISANNPEYPEINNRLNWSSPSPILRANNGTMSGVRVRVVFDIKGNTNCNFG